MIEVGKYHQLKVRNESDAGLHLDVGHGETILLPKSQVPEGVNLGDELRVFVYPDSDDLPIATTRTPNAALGDVAYLRVNEVNQVGAFLDWGLPKELLLPFKEQIKPVEEGRRYVVTLFREPYTQRVAASTKLNRFLKETNDDFKPRQAVKLQVWGRTDLGFKCVIDDSHLGLLHNSDIFRKVSYGQVLDGFIKDIRDDGKINLTLQIAGKAGRDDLSQKILDHLKANGGRSDITDKTDPQVIYRQFGVSKKNYKKALGGLYKQRLIRIEPDRITLLD